MNRVLRLALLAGILVATAGSANAASVLFDVNRRNGPVGPTTLQDFIDAGVTEDLTGATALSVEGSPNSAMTVGGITLSYAVGTAFGDFSNASFGNKLLDDYIFLTGALTAVTMEISGLASVLDPNTDYALYLFGAGDSLDQGADFTFGGQTISTPPNAPPVLEDARFALFSFTTGGAVSDTLQFDWDRGARSFSGMNGFAIVESVPEPGVAMLLGLGLALVGLGRLRR
jgi:hypothetical protein